MPKDFDRQLNEKFQGRDWREIDDEDVEELYVPHKKKPVKPKKSYNPRKDDE